MEALRRTIKLAGPDVPVLGFAASPWTLACYMVEGRTKEGFATVKSFLYQRTRSSFASCCRKSPKPHSLFEGRKSRLVSAPYNCLIPGAAN